MSENSVKLLNMERRGALRLRLQEKCQIGQQGNGFYDAVSYDISDSGICVKSSEFIPKNTAVKVILQHQEAPLNLEGEIVWVSGKSSTNQYKMGIRITSPNGELTNIYNYLLRMT